MEVSNQSLPEQLDEVKRKVNVLENLLEASRIVSSSTLQEVIVIRSVVTKQLNSIGR